MSSTGARCIFLFLFSLERRAGQCRTRAAAPTRGRAAPAQVAKNFLGCVPTVQDPFSCRRRAHGWQAAAALLDLPRGTGAAAGARTKPGALQISPSKAQPKGITLNYQVPRNILLPCTLQIHNFSNNPLTALTTSVTYSPVLREGYY